MTEKALQTAKFDYDIKLLPAVIFLEHQLSPEMIKGLNIYLDEERKNPKKESLNNGLVGQIHKGEQLSMDFECQELKAFRLMIEGLGGAYLKHFVDLSGATIKPKQVGMDKLWSVHSYEGDYNPIHDHQTHAPMGISFTTWTKVPEQIGKTLDGKDPKAYNLYDSSGAVDGFLVFTYGINQTSDPERLRPTQSRYVKPEVGKLLLFPSWMQHAVYPFFGEGERQTVAGNLNCWDIVQEDKLKN